MNGGGYFAMVRSPTLGIKIYFWSRDSADVPPEIRESGSGGGSLYPDSSWGVPAADFPMCPDLCNYDAHFNAHQIVFDLTFCVSDLFYLPCTFFARARLRFFLLHRVTGLAMLGPHRDVARVLAWTVSVPLTYSSRLPCSSNSTDFPQT
jgi:hypothetical protein